MEESITEHNGQSATPATTSDTIFVGIRGWLLLLSLGIYFSCLVGWLMPGVFFADLVDFIQNLPFEDGATLNGHRVLASPSDYFWAAFQFLYFLCYVSLYVWRCVIAYRFPKKLHTTPAALIKLFKFQIAVAGAILIIGVAGGIRWPNADQDRVILNLLAPTLLTNLVTLFIWGSYLKRSKRVKATFVN